jgi:hypothetical protein
VGLQKIRLRSKFLKGRIAIAACKFVNNALRGSDC